MGDDEEPVSRTYFDMGRSRGPREEILESDGPPDFESLTRAVALAFAGLVDCSGLLVHRHADVTFVVDPAVDPNRVLVFTGHADPADFCGEVGFVGPDPLAVTERLAPVAEEVPARPRKSYEEWLAESTALLAECEGQGK